MKKVVEVSHVQFGYTKDQLIFKDLNLEVYAGEYVCLIGHNGSGKSTLAKLLIGLNEIKAGNITIFDKELNEQNIYDIREILKEHSEFAGAEMSAFATANYSDYDSDTKKDGIKNMEEEDEKARDLDDE